MLKLSYRESLLRKLEQNLPPFKPEMTRLPRLPLMVPDKRPLSRKQPLLLSPSNLKLRESLLLLTTKFKLPSKNSKTSKLPRLHSLHNKQLPMKSKRELRRLRLLDLPLKSRKQLDWLKLPQRRPLLMPRLTKSLLRNGLMRTKKLKKQDSRLLLRKKDSKQRLLTPLNMSRKWPIRRPNSLNLKLMLKLLKLDKPLLPQLLSMLRLRD
jgi:hypothetical protein